MVSDLSSKFLALLEHKKRRLDRSLGEDLREIRAKYGGGSYTVLRIQQRYETDIEERLSTIIATLSQLLADASAREIRDSRQEFDRLARDWLRSHIEICQRTLDEHVARIGSVGTDQYDLGRDRVLNALTVELDLLSTSSLTGRQR